MISRILPIVAYSSSGGIDIKAVALLLLVLIGCGAVAYLCRAIPAPWSWLIYLVLGIVAFVAVYRFIEAM